MSREAGNPVFKTLATSIVFAGIALGMWAFAPTDVPRSHTVILGLAFAAGVSAVIFGRSLRLGNAWLVLCAIATPALVLAPVYRPPVWLFPLVTLVLAGFYVNGVREKVPLYLSNLRTRKQVADLLHPGAGRVFVDLGCGLGGIVDSVGRARPDAVVIGVETAPLSFLIAWARIALFGPRNARIKFQSIWSTDLSEADVVYAFLSPAPMERLWQKVSAEMKPGSLFISNSFAVPGKEPDVIVPVDDARQTQLLVWKM